MGSWDWKRPTPTRNPFSVWIFDSMGIEYAWLSDPHNGYGQTHRVAHCTGEFLGRVDVPK